MVRNLFQRTDNKNSRGHKICNIRDGDLSRKKEHWQTYIELEKPQRMSWLKKAYGDTTVHLEARKGSRSEAKDYCMKDGTWEEHGKWIKGQGHRSDLDNVVDRLVEGDKLCDIMMEDPATYCRYRQGLKDVAEHVAKKKK